MCDRMLATRLRNQRLTATTFTRPVDVVRWLGAVQAQDYAGAVWALALRARGLTAAAIDRAFDDGRILRTHVLRPTWHFVAPEDIRWLQALTGPRVQALNAVYGRRHGIDARTFARGRALMERALAGGRHLTRAELAAALARGGIVATGQRLAHLVMAAELEAAICSGPRRGKQFTYALLAERAPRARALPRDEALATLGRRYFRSHGPATLRDFAWWSGLTIRDARAAADAVEPALVLPAPPPADRAAGAHFLLPNYDEYLIAHRDRGAVLDPSRARNLGMWTSLEYPHQVVVDGRVAGSWQRQLGPREVTVRLQLHAPVGARAAAALAAAAARLGGVFGVPGRVVP
jgi:hypothetical protein